MCLNNVNFFFIIIIMYKRIFERVREKSGRGSNFKSFENKNAKVSFLNSRISKFNKFNRNNNVKISHNYKNNENK